MQRRPDIKYIDSIFPVVICDKMIFAEAEEMDGRDVSAAVGNHISSKTHFGTCSLERSYTFNRCFLSTCYPDLWHIVILV